MRIQKQDNNGTKPLLQVGELGYDNFEAGGDKGRVYVGTGSENIPLAKKSEKQDTLISGENLKTINGLSLLGSGDISGIGTGSVSSVSGTGTVAGLTLSGTVTSTGSLTLSGALQVHPNVSYTEIGYLDGVTSSIQEQLDSKASLVNTFTKVETTNIVNDAVANIVNSAPAALDTLSELASALGNDPDFATTISTAIGNRVVKNANITAGTATKVTYDSKGLVTGGTTLSAGDIPTLNQNTTGSAATLTTGRTIGMTGDVTWTSSSFNGSSNVTGVSTLKNTGTAGTYRSVTTDAQGRVTSGTNPTTLVGYGITDAFNKTEVTGFLSGKVNTGDLGLVRTDTTTASTIVIDGSAVQQSDTKVFTIKGSSTAPSNDLQYDKPAMYIEVNSNTNVIANSNWGNAKKAGGLFIEAKSWSGFNGELNSAYFRTYTNQYSAGNENALVGISAIAQTNTGAGNNSADVWGANIIAAQTSGNAPQDIVGIEVDVLHSSASTTSTNYTGVWCQADGSGQYSNNAFMATRSGQSAGWRHVIKADVEALDSTIEVKNGLNAPGADGMNIGITYGAENTNIINAYTVTDTNTNFKVTGDASYPVWIKINGVLKKVMEGPPNSGGAGYKQLIVVN